MYKDLRFNLGGILLLSGLCLLVSGLSPFDEGALFSGIAGTFLGLLIVIPNRRKKICLFLIILGALFLLGLMIFSVLKLFVW